MLRIIIDRLSSTNKICVVIIWALLYVSRYCRPKLFQMVVGCSQGSFTRIKCTQYINAVVVYLTEKIWTSIHKNVIILHGKCSK
jgi:hypothetical protein